MTDSLRGACAPLNLVVSDKQKGIIEMEILAVTAAAIAFLALIFAYGLSSWVVKTDEGDEGMRELSGFIKESAAAFVKMEFFVLIPVILVFIPVIGFIIGWTAAALYAAGAFSSVLAGFFGMWAALRGSARTVSAAMDGGMNKALKTALRSGAVMGLCAVGFGLLGIGGVFAVFGIESAPEVTGFGLGVSTAALFGCVAAGIFKKAADTGAELIGKAKAKLTEGDPRNPAAMAAYAGDYAGNAAGMGLDLLESYAGSIIAAVTIAAATKSINPAFGYPFDLPVVQGVAFPLLIPAAGIVAGIAGIMLIGGNVRSDPAKDINAGKYLSNGIVAIFSIILSWVFFGNFNCAVSILIGVAAGAAVGKTARTYAFGTSRRLRKMTERLRNGYQITGEYGVGMLSTLWPAIFLAAGILTANLFAGLYGIALAAVGMLSTAGMTAAIDAYCPVSGNAGKIARIAGLSDEAEAIMDKLDSAGKVNTATGKGYASGAAALTAAALFIAYSTITKLDAVDLLKPAVIAGLLAGAALPVLLAAMTMNTAGKTSFRMMENVRKQFDSNAGIMKGASRPDYAGCAKEGAKAALKGIAVPGLLAILAPLTAGIFAGTEVLGGLLAGSLASGMLTSVILANTGGPWNHPDKSSTDPFKDAAGSSVNVFMKLTAMISVAFTPVFVLIGGLL